MIQGKKRGLTWEGGSVARGLGTPVTAGRRRERRRACGGGRWRGVPQPGPLALPQGVRTRRGPTSPRRPRERGRTGGTRLRLPRPAAAPSAPAAAGRAPPGLGSGPRPHGADCGEGKAVSPSRPGRDGLPTVATGPGGPRPRPGKVLVGRADGLQLPAQALPCEHLLLQGLLELPQRHLGRRRRRWNGLRSCRLGLRAGPRLGPRAPAAPKTRAQALGGDLPSASRSFRNPHSSCSDPSLLLPRLTPALVSGLCSGPFAPTFHTGAKGLFLKLLPNLTMALPPSPVPGSVLGRRPVWFVSLFGLSLSPLPSPPSPAPSSGSISA